MVTVRRRDLLAGAAGLAVVGTGAAVAAGDWDPLDDDQAIEPIELDGIDAPGSRAAPVTVPERGSVSVIEVFATWCGACRRMMDELVVVHGEVGDDVQFVSVTNEPLGDTVTHEDVAAWWNEHDGQWQVAHDAELDLTERLSATGVPYSVVLDEENRIQWSDQGYKTAGELLDPIEATLE